MACRYSVASMSEANCRGPASFGKAIASVALGSPELVDVRVTSSVKARSPPLAQRAALPPRMPPQNCLRRRPSHQPGESSSLSRTMLDTRVRSVGMRRLLRHRREIYDGSTHGDSVDRQTKRWHLGREKDGTARRE
eukprot:scaffold304613_cov33-Tisochrysis_lutea.AAC.2